MTHSKDELKVVVDKDSILYPVQAVINETDKEVIIFSPTIDAVIHHINSK
jgi:hypothetical protein